MEREAIPAPSTIEELGIRKNFLEDLALKTMYLIGEMTTLELAHQMGLGLGIVSELTERLQKEHFCEVIGLESGRYFRFITTSSGKSRALELLDQSQYFGPAPVSLGAYVGQILAQSIRGLPITPEDLRRTFEDLVLDVQLLNQLGTAAVSGRAVFLYGPTGTGKTIIAQTLARLFDDQAVWLPYAVEMDGQVITVYDSVLHQKVERPLSPNQDNRWVLCRRPRVVVGGELSSDMLDFQFNRSTRYYTAPVQMKANNGLLIVDDFGRQRIRPEQLLNRWVVPLDRGTDFLTLAGGRKIEIPFDILVVFATNLEPSTLADEAFLRRIQTKIKIDFVTPDQFREIFRRVCVQSNLTCDAPVTDELLRVIQQEYGEPLRACYPRDIVQHVLWEARYFQREPRLDLESLTRACRSYFLARPSGDLPAEEK